MANPCEQYCLDVMTALAEDYDDPDFNWQVRKDLGPTRMQAKDLLLTISVADWRTWHDGCMVRATVRFSLLVKYHATSAEQDGEGWWNAVGLVAGISSWLTWRRIGASVKLSMIQADVGPSYDRDGAWSGWLILWEDDIELPARFEYHFADRVDDIGPEPASDLSDLIDSQYVEVGIEQVEQDVEPETPDSLPEGITAHDVATADYEVVYVE